MFWSLGAGSNPFQQTAIFQTKKSLPPAIKQWKSQRGWKTSSHDSHVNVYLTLRIYGSFFLAWKTYAILYSTIPTTTTQHPPTALQLKGATLLLDLTASCHNVTKSSGISLADGSRSRLSVANGSKHEIEN